MSVEMSIKRYEPTINHNYGDPYAHMEEDCSGGCVLYEDHVAEVEALKKEIEELEETLEVMRDNAWDSWGEDN